MVRRHATTQFPKEREKVWDCDSPDRQMNNFMDISQAYFNAKVDGDDPVYDELHEGPVLKRVVRWTSSGLEYEADPSTSGEAHS